MPFERRDHRLVEVGQLLQAAEAADAVVAVRPLGAFCRGLEVPAGAEELLAAAGDDRDPQLGIVAETGEGPAQCPAGGAVDGVGLGPVEHDLQDAVTSGDADRFAHDASILGYQSNQDIGRDGTQAGGAHDQGVDVELDQTVAMLGREPGHGQGGRHHGIDIAGGPAAKAGEQRRALQPEHGRAHLGLGRRQQQQRAVGQELDQDAARADHQAQADLRVADDAQDQLGHAVRDHRLDQDRLAQAGHARGGGLDRGGVAQVQRHRAQLALVGEGRAGSLDHDRIAQGIGGAYGLGRGRDQSAARMRQGRTRPGAACPATRPA